MERLTVPLVLVATDNPHKTRNLLNALSTINMKINIDDKNRFSIENCTDEA